jgi:hypothetical protein
MTMAMTTVTTIVVGTTGGEETKLPLEDTLSVNGLFFMKRKW